MLADKISTLLYPPLRHLLFSMPAELSHTLTLGTLSFMQQLHLANLLAPYIAAKPVEVMGIQFPNPVGLAAGLDKNADHLDALAALGFGFIEVGTVTPRPQPGNPKPRMFRVPEAGAIINRMGFNNRGVDHLVKAVQRSHYRGILGINIGKNKDTPAERAVDDYLICLRKVYPHASYVVVNLSSPNTPGLRDLQFGQALTDLLAALKQEQRQLASEHNRYVPLAVKIAPDMAIEDIQSVAQVLREQQLDAVVATNTTIARDAVANLKHGNEAGGLSGRPLRESSTRVIRELSAVLQGELPIIGVGGVDDGASAAEKIRAGASLVQVYTGFIYRGPVLISEAVDAIRRLA